MPLTTYYPAGLVLFNCHRWYNLLKPADRMSKDSSRPTVSAASSSSATEQNSQREKSEGWFKRARNNFLSGATAGTVTAALLQPLDVIKTVQQGQRSVATDAQSAEWIKKSRSPLGAAKAIYRDGGILAFWRGLEASVVRVFFGAGLYFCTLQTIVNFKRADDKSGENKKPSSSRAFSAGAIARSFAATVMNPVSVVKTRVEWGSQKYTHGVATSSNPYRHTIPAAIHIARTEGIRGLYAGLLPTIVRDAPYSGIYFLSFSTLKSLIARHSIQDPNAVQQATRNFSAGLLGGVIATLCTHPADVLKTRLQVDYYQRMDTSASSLGVLQAVKHKSSGVIYELKHILRHEGIASLYSGATVRVAKRAFSTAVTWTIFEEGLRRMRKPSPEGR
eukprot:gb/GECG01005369.1/.p1 GENE.gb/GECG01005369.1/~~gb/GECG01005369.1/.p1  ORF type:complete len:390 (+),score=31.56 gb/GECG01005369.1/:1-1170(+)